MTLAYLCCGSPRPGNLHIYQRLKFWTSRSRVFVFSQVPFDCPDLEAKSAGVSVCPGRAFYLDRLFYPLWAVLAVRRLARTAKDRVIIYSTPAHLAVLAAWILKKMGHVWVADVWDDFEKSLSDTWYEGRRFRIDRLAYFWILYRMAARSLRTADLVVWCQHMDRLKSYQTREERVLHLVHGVASDLLPQANRQGADRFGIVYLGSVAPTRGVKLIVEAARRLKETAPAALWSVIGPDHEWLAAEVKQSGLSDCVQVIGPLPHREALERVAEADVALCLLRPVAEHLYAYTTKLLEYLALGKAIVATDLPGIREIIRHEENGLLVPPEEPVALAEAVHRLAEDPPLRERLGAQARKDAEQFEWSVLHERLAARVERLITGYHAGKY